MAVNQYTDAIGLEIDQIYQLISAHLLDQGATVQPPETYGATFPATHQPRTDQRLFEELQALSCPYRDLDEIAVQINRLFAIDEILQLVGQKVKWLLDFDHCGVCLCQARRFTPI